MLGPVYFRPAHRKKKVLDKEVEELLKSIKASDSTISTLEADRSSVQKEGSRISNSKKKLEENLLPLESELQARATRLQLDSGVYHGRVGSEAEEKLQVSTVEAV